jgi:hypothetical protein
MNTAMDKIADAVTALLLSRRIGSHPTRTPIRIPRRNIQRQPGRGLFPRLDDARHPSSLAAVSQKTLPFLTAPHVPAPIQAP